MRAVVESGKLSNKDLFELSLANKSICGVAYQEVRRLKIRTTPFFNNRQNPLWCYIELDQPDALKKALELADFENDIKSTNGRVLHSDGGTGVHLLIKCCIQQGAARCLAVVMKWADRSSKFSYDPKWVYELAWHEARHGGRRLECLLSLHDRDKDGSLPPPEPTYTILLETIRAPAAVAWLSRRLPPDTDYLSILFEQCGNKYIHPAVVEATMDLITPEMIRTVRPTQSRPTTFIHAVAAAASVLHIPLIDLLLQRGPTVFFQDAKALYGANVPNPVYSALCHPLPGKPEEERHRVPRTPPHNPPSMADLKKRWIRETSQTANMIYVACQYLLDHAHIEAKCAAALERDAEKVNDRLLMDLLDGAAMVYLHNLRAFLLGNLRWLLPSSSADTTGTSTTTSSRSKSSKPARSNPKSNTKGTTNLRDALLTPATPGRKTAYSISPLATSLLINPLVQPPPPLPQQDHTDPDSDTDSDDEHTKQQQEKEYEKEHHKLELRYPGVDESIHPLTWQPKLSGSIVRARLEKEQGIVLPKKVVGMWGMLVTPGIAAAAEKYLKVDAARVEGMYLRGKEDQAELLWELLVAEARAGAEEGVEDAEAGR
jgi:hypothetical protein